MPCYSPLKGYKDPISGGLVFKKPLQGYPQALEVACSQCLGCRLDRALMWAIRIVHESTLWADQYSNSFITLTYRDKIDCTTEQLRDGYHIPADGSLNKKHFQDFIKRVRKKYQRYFKCVIKGEHKSICTNPIRYFHCGEYGTESFRPHYHACMFNLSFPDQAIYTSGQGITTYESKLLQKLWPFGFSTIGELNFDTAAYTARYILKKVNGHNAPDHYLRCDEDGVAFWLLPEYVTMSLKPGIGRGFYEKFQTDIFPSDETPVPGKGVIRKVPRYYETILATQNPEQLELVKKLRQIFIQKHASDFTPQRLRAKYEVQKARLSTSKRNKI